MDNIFIVCVDDQREVLNAISQDLGWLDDEFNLEICESASEVLEIIE